MAVNSAIPAAQLTAASVVLPPAKELLKLAIVELNFSGRAYDKILKVSRTIADLAESENILPEHICESIQYRSLDRNMWL